MAKKKQDKIDLGERGFYSPRNKLNELTGKEWIKFSKSWFIHNPPRRKRDELLHPAKFPESLVQEFVEFFTKPNQWVLDPLLGTGSTLVACRQCARNGIGIELDPKYARIAKQRLTQLDFPGDTRQVVRKGDALDAAKLLAEEGIQAVDYCITSPPYWDQLKRHSLRQKDRKRKGLSTNYRSHPNGLGSIEGYDAFLEAQARIFDAVYDVMKPKGYLTIITNNVFSKGRVYPLAFDTVAKLSRRGERSWVPKDERIWLQNDKRLIALGVNHSYVGNRHHQYCLIFRKEVTTKGTVDGTT